MTGGPFCKRPSLHSQPFRFGPRGGEPRGGVSAAAETPGGWAAAPPGRGSGPGRAPRRRRLRRGMGRGGPGRGAAGPGSAGRLTRGTRPRFASAGDGRRMFCLKGEGAAAAVRRRRRDFRMKWISYKTKPKNHHRKQPRGKRVQCLDACTEFVAPSVPASRRRSVAARRGPAGGGPAARQTKGRAGAGGAGTCPVRRRGKRRPRIAAAAAVPCGVEPLGWLYCTRLFTFIRFRPRLDEIRWRAWRRAES